MKKIKHFGDQKKCHFAKKNQFYKVIQIKLGNKCKQHSVFHYISQE
jgi:hypothetical protein